MNTLFDQMKKLTENQSKLIEMGVPTRDIAHEKMIYDAEVIEDVTS